MPLTNAHHGGDREPPDLRSRIDLELRTRLEEAVDYACLEALVTARRAAGAPAPVADSARDREEFMARVLAFLERLRVEISARLTDEQRQRLGDAITRPAADAAGAIGVQVALANTLPDYWQQFEAVRGSVTEPPSGGEHRGLLGRLLRRG